MNLQKIMDLVKTRAIIADEDPNGDADCAFFTQVYILLDELRVSRKTPNSISPLSYAPTAYACPPFDGRTGGAYYEPSENCVIKIILFPNSYRMANFKWLIDLLKDKFTRQEIRGFFDRAEIECKTSDAEKIVRQIFDSGGGCEIRPD
jgi:hypothetical protein